MSSVTTSLKLDPDIKERVQRIAADRRRTSHWIMREAITQYVAEAERRKEIREAVAEGWDDYQRTGLHVTQEEMEVWFARIEAGEDVPPPECHV